MSLVAAIPACFQRTFFSEWRIFRLLVSNLVLSPNNGFYVQFQFQFLLIVLNFPNDMEQNWEEMNLCFTTVSLNGITVFCACMCGHALLELMHGFSRKSTCHKGSLQVHNFNW
jgi:hypothetical protein